MAAAGSCGYDAWAGVPWQLDAEESTLAIAGAGGCDWLVTDHYSFDMGWERRMRAVARHIFVIDDLADRPHDCDLLLDQNAIEGGEQRYLEKVPCACRLLLGPRYALLQPAYASWHRMVAPRRGSARNLIVFFGGVDAEDLTGLSLRALQRVGRNDVAVNVVVGSGNAHHAEIVELAASMPSVRLLNSLPTLAPLMAEADLALGAGGTTVWERCCLGLPSLVITSAANQHTAARQLHDLGLINWLGDAGGVDVESFAAAMLSALDGNGAEPCSRRCMALVDGHGTDRVVSAVTATAALSLTLRSAEPGDEELMLNWANDPAVRANGFANGKIEPETHHRWFSRRLSQTESCRIYIAENDSGMPVGQVRFERRDDGWQIGYSLDAAFRGLGLGRALLEHALRRLATEVVGGQAIAIVKEGNIQSCRIFQRLGFTPHETETGITEFRRPLSAVSS